MGKLGYLAKKSKHNLAVKIGKVESSLENEFDDMKRNFDTSQTSVEEAIKHAKRIHQHYASFASSLDLVFQDFQNTYSISDPVLSSAQRVHQQFEDFDRASCKALETNISQRVVEPLAMYSAEFSRMNPQLMTRELAKMKYDSKRSLVKSLTEKRKEKDLEKLAKAKEKLRRYEEIYKQQNRETKIGMAEILNKKGDVLDPSLDAFIDSLHEIALNMTNTCAAMKLMLQEGRKNASSRVPIKIAAPVEPGTTPGLEGGASSQMHGGGNMNEMDKHDELDAEGDVDELYTFGTIAHRASVANAAPAVPSSGGSRQNRSSVIYGADNGILEGATGASKAEPKQFDEWDAFDAPAATMSSTQMTASTVVPPPLPAPASSIPAEFDTQWFYLDESVIQQGPIPFVQLKQMYKSRKITGETYVFRDSMSSWEQIANMQKLRAVLM